MIRSNRSSERGEAAVSRCFSNFQTTCRNVCRCAIYSGLTKSGQGDEAADSQIVRHRFTWCFSTLENRSL
ncbi:hypothetical protein HMPREF3156_00874 [Neisseria sp. HMSC06F02]|nr:hypothetical protein HMPREF3156_00874 [Neisseria sp. HMSC06F02]